MKTMRLTFVRDKVTTNDVRFKEQSARVKPLYVPREDAGDARRLNVTIEDADARDSAREDRHAG